MAEKTVRELTGEIWAELESESRNAAMNGSPLKTMSVDALNRILDVIMGVLARHENTLLVNDRDLPVEPLGRWYRE